MVRAEAIEWGGKEEEFNPEERFAGGVLEGHQEGTELEKEERVLLGGREGGTAEMMPILVLHK